MYFTNEWKILAPKNELKTYLPNQIEFRTGNSIKLSNSLNEHIENVWKEELKIAEMDETILKNDPLVRFSGLKEVNNNLIIYTSLTNYKEFVATCLLKNKEKFKKNYGREISIEESASTFASETLPITLDDYVVVFKRSDKVHLSKGQFSIPSGGRWGSDPREIYRAMLKSTDELFERCRDLVRNEFSNKIDVKEDSQKLLGLTEITSYNDHALLFSINLDADYNTIKKNKDKILIGNKKYVDLKLVKFEKLAFTNFLNNNVKKIAFWVYPALIMAGAHKFGEDWPLSIKGIRKIK